MSSFSICEAGCTGHGAYDFILVECELVKQWKVLSFFESLEEVILTHYFPNSKSSQKARLRNLNLPGFQKTLALHAIFWNWLFLLKRVDILLILSVGRRICCSVSI